MQTAAQRVALKVATRIVSSGAWQSASGSINDSHYSLYTYLWHLDPLKTEQRIYRELMREPLAADTCYVGVPWTFLINANQTSAITLPRFERKAFTVCQHIHYRQIIPQLVDCGIRTLFTPHADCDRDDILLAPMPIYPAMQVSPAPVKDLLFSFVGCDHAMSLDANGAWKPNDVRRRIFDLAKRRPLLSSAIIERAGWYFYRPGRHDAAEYCDVLSRSRFSLCPRGTGSNSIRLWESFIAGAIPVVLSDGLRLPSLPDIIWKDCVLRVPEDEVDDVPDILESIPVEREAQMRAAGLALASGLFARNGFSTVVRANPSLRP